MITQFHAKYFAHDLTRQAPPGAADQLSMSLFDASVDLNPHQIEAAMFALQSPLSEGVTRPERSLEGICSGAVLAASPQSRNSGKNGKPHTPGEKATHLQHILPPKPERNHSRLLLL
jgi:hypothetical protein